MLPDAALPLSALPLIGLQQAFAAALQQPGGAVPCGIAAASPASALKRFNVYRNNMHASLAAALAARFPVVQRIVGEEFFQAMALVFVGRHPPASPILALYGGAFAGFLEAFEPVRDLPYLPDMARLEWQRNLAHDAADASAMPLTALAAIDPALLPDMRLLLHPAVCWLASDYPIATIWQANTHDEIVGPLDGDAGGECVLVTRPLLDVLVTRLPPGSEVFLAALANRQNLGDAATQAAAALPDFDLPAALAALFDSGAISELRGPDDRPVD